MKVNTCSELGLKSGKWKINMGFRALEGMKSETLLISGEVGKLKKALRKARDSE